MSNKLVLNFICKNEEKVIERMLTSALPITDVIVALDTGSTDNTINLIRAFGEKHNIPTVVYESPFTTYAGSRNMARQKCSEYVDELKLDRNKTWSYFFDCDETLIISDQFNKNAIDKDFYMVETQIGTMKYTRNTFTRMSKGFEWVGPIHEFLNPTETFVSGGIMAGIIVDVTSEGHTWTENIHKKYKGHATVLEDYIFDPANRNGRWVFYTAQSWWDAAQSGNKDIDTECLRRALVYYKERAEMRGGVDEERFYAQFRIGQIMRILQEPWGETIQELKKAYSIDPVRGEPIREIVEYYGQIGDWNNAYIYSKFATAEFFNKNPYKYRTIYVESDYYNWKVFSMHATVCLYTKRMAEAKNSYNIVLDVYSKHPEFFNEDDVNKLKFNAKFFS